MQAAAASPRDEVVVLSFALVARASCNALLPNTGLRVAAAARLAQAAARAHPHVQPIVVSPHPFQPALDQHVAVQHRFRECCTADGSLSSLGSSLGSLVTDGGGLRESRSG